MRKLQNLPKPRLESQALTVGHQISACGDGRRRLENR